MNILDKIKGRTKIDVDIFVERLKKDFNIDKIENEEKKEIANEEMLNSIYEVLILILDKIHQSKVPVGLYTTCLQMVRDYWYLNKYDKKYVSNIDAEENGNSNIRVKSIQVGDTTTTFADTSSQIDINGTTYNTGTVDFDEDMFIEKYKKRLYEHRKMRW